jgi:hypothetical protein
VALCGEADYLRGVVEVLLDAVFGFYSPGYGLVRCFSDRFSKDLARNLVTSNSHSPVNRIYGPGNVEEPVRGPLRLPLNYGIAKGARNGFRIRLELG